MAGEVDNLVYPYTAVVAIFCTFGDETVLSWSGTGVIVGKNDVLTAAHVVYDPEKGGYATKVVVVPGFDAAPLEEMPFGSFEAKSVQAFTDFGAYRENDVAILGFDSFIAQSTSSGDAGARAGMMFLDPYFVGGLANATGYPNAFDGNPWNERSEAFIDPAGSYIDISNFNNIYPGSSGSPLWTMEDQLGHVGGVVASAHRFAGIPTGQGEYASSVVWNYTTLDRWIEGNDNLVNDPGLYVVLGSGDQTFVGGSRGDQIDGGGGSDTLSGGGGNDILNGGSGADFVFGGSGTDWMFGGGDADTLDGGSGADTMSGGTGDDTYIVGQTTDLVIENADEGLDTIQSSVTFTLQPNVENLVLTGTRNINGTGNGEDNLLRGNSGNNVLAGLAGEDWLAGGAGTDTATYVASTAGVIVSLTAGFGLGGDAEGDVLIEIENLTGSSFGDVLEGTSGSNTLVGGAGLDTITYERAAAGVTVSLALTGAQDTIGAGVDTLRAFENLTGSAFDDVLTGSSAQNILRGLAGNDTLTGGGGVDWMLGGTENDTYIVGQTTDLVIENADEGLDTIQSSVTFTLQPNVENLVLTGTRNINGTGNGEDNLLRGNSGNNVLAGLGGGDLLDGDTGTDTATYAASSTRVNVSLASSLGVGGDAEGDTLVNVENLTGSSFDDIVEGDSANNVLVGGAGIDTLSYERAAAGVTVSLALTGAQDTIGAGIDTLRTFESLIGSTFDDVLTGSGVANALQGLAGNDTLRGGGGTDTLDGGADNDILTGGLDADTFVFKTGYGADKITDFLVGVDKIDVRGVTGIANFSDIQAHTNATGVATINFGDGDTLSLQKVNLLQLHESDFIFAPLTYTYTYTYTIIDHPLARDNSTYGVGINDAGDIVGRYYADSFYGSRGFIYSNGDYSTFAIHPNAPINPTGINDAGQIAGSYGSVISGLSYGFVYSDGNYTTLDAQSGGQPLAVGINDAGQVAGYTWDGNTSRGFIYSAGNYTFFDGPSSSRTIVNAINDAGDVVGYYQDAVGTHGFLFKDGVLTTLDHELGTSEAFGPQTVLTGINDTGQIVGYYNDGANNLTGFIFSEGTFSEIDGLPAEPYTLPLGINDAGQIAGYFVDSANLSHSYIATPVQQISNYDLL